MRLAFPSWVGIPFAGLVALVAWKFQTHSVSFAAAGAVIAVLGVLTIGRPIFRLGYSEWLKNHRSLDGGYFTPEEEPPEYKREKEEEEKDALAVQFIGPLLVSVGTLLNGFSGFIK